MASGVQCVMIVSLQVMLLLPVVSLDLMTTSSTTELGMLGKSLHMTS